LNSTDPVGTSLEALSYALKKKGNSRLALGMSRYMKDRFVYYGVKSPDRKIIFKGFKNQVMDLVQQGFLEDILIRLWENEEREMQYCALDLLDISKKHFTRETLDLIERLILSKSWWDTVDMLAGKSAGFLFLKFPELRAQRMPYWINHSDFWLNRSAIIHQLNYKGKTDFEWLKKSILPHIHSEEFFLRKAIGWALRQYCRTDAQAVVRFVNEHPDLSNLSKKEALRLLPVLNDKV